MPAGKSPQTSRTHFKNLQNYLTIFWTLTFIGSRLIKSSIYKIFISCWWSYLFDQVLNKISSNETANNLTSNLTDTSRISALTENLNKNNFPNIFKWFKQDCKWQNWSNIFLAIFFCIYMLIEYLIIYCHYIGTGNE